MLKVHALWLLLVIFSCSANAAPIDDADAALMRGEYETAVATLMVLAESGDAVAMVRLASLYHRGEGVTRNIEKAVGLYLSSAELGNADAQFNLGNMYLLGEGVEEDKSWALTFYRLAAKQGHQLATANLNEMIRAGVAADVESDGAEQADFPAVESADADLNIVDGDVVSSDLDSPVAPIPADRIPQSQEPLVHAEQRLEKAVDDARQLDDEQDITHEETHADRADAALARLDRDDETIADSVASSPSELVAIASSDASVSAEGSLINLEPLQPSEEAPAYSSDEAQAIKIAERHGITVNIDGEPIKAEESTSEVGVAAPEQYAEQVARFEQAERLLADGETDQGIALLTQLATDGYAEAAAELSVRAERGEGLDQSRSESLRWRQIAAELGDVQAQFQLAEQFMRGDGVDPDDAMAITYYRDAARGGHALAKEKLQLIYADAGLPLPDFSRPRAPIQIYPKPADATADDPSSAVDDDDETITSGRSTVDEKSTVLSSTGEGALPSELDPPSPSTSVNVVPEQEHTDVEPLMAEDDVDPLEPTGPQPAIHADADPVVETNAIVRTPAIDRGDAPVKLVAIDSVSPPKTLHNVIADTTTSPQEAVHEKDVVTPSASIPRRTTSPTIVVTHPPPYERISSQRAIEIEPPKPANHQVIPGSLLAIQAKELPIVYEGGASIPPGEQSNERVGVDVTQSDDDMHVEPVVPELVDSEPAVDTESAAIVAVATQVIAESTQTILEENKVPAAATTTQVDQGSDVVALVNPEPPKTGILGRMKNLFSRDPDKSFISSVGFKSGSAATTINQMRGAGLATATTVAKSAPSIESNAEQRPQETTGSNEGEQLIVMRMDNASDALSEEAMVETQEQTDITVGGTIQDAKIALAERRFAQAAGLFGTLAEDGDSEAQAHLGYMFYQGEGVSKNLEQAVEWYRRAAVQGNRDAQYNLAVAYAFGEGVAQDDIEAVNWYRRAAEQGSAIAQYSLGVSYALGEGVPRDDVEGMRWYRAAAEQGYAAAQYNLGYGYRSGQGTEVDNVQALEWFLAAASNGHASAQYSLGYMYRSGRGVERNVDEAAKWYRLAAAQGHLDARADLASLNPDTL